MKQFQRDDVTNAFALRIVQDFKEVDPLATFAARIAQPILFSTKKIILIFFNFNR